MSLAQAQQDPKAEKILEAMTKKYQSLKVFSATFNQTL
jgi:outer membrane lipoprotein-sorting protein